jgi:hypothetical protein
MKNQNNLLNMMQTGGLTSTSGGAALARALQRQKDTKRLERQQRREARRQKKGRRFGSIGSLFGGLLAATLAPATGGLSLALASGLGSAAGKRIGEGLGAGKTKKYDRTGTVYSQQKFKDVQQASRDYTRGMGERALQSGLSTALTAGLTPGGGIYGEDNLLRSGNLARMFNIGGDKFASKVTEQGIADNPFLAEQFDDVFDVVDGIPIDIDGNPIGLPSALTSNLPKDVLADASSLPLSKGAQSYFNNDMIQKVAQPSLPQSNLLGKAKNYASNLNDLGLARMYGLGGKKFAQDVTNQGILDNASLLMGNDTDEFAFLDDVQQAPDMQASLLGLNDKINQYNNVPSFQNGGLLGYRKGAYVGGGDEDYGDAGTGGSEVITPPDADAPASGFAGTGSPLGNDTGMSPVANATSSSPIGGSSYTAAGILGEAGLMPTAEQLAMFQDFDPSVINRAKQQSEQGLLSMTGGMGLSSVGGGFGARQRAGSEAVETAGERIGDVAEQAQTDYESQVLGQVAADIASEEVDYKKKGTSTQDDPVYGQFDKPPVDDVNWNPPVGAGAGTPYDFNGVRYIFDAPNWVTEEQYESDMADYYDPYG